MKAMEEINRLIDQKLDGTIDEAGMQRLNQWIKESPENADYFVQRSHMHSCLFDWAKVKDPKVVEFQPKFRWLRSTLGVAAAVVGLLLVGNWILQPEPGIPVATMTASVESELWYQGKSQKPADKTIRTGDFELRGGVASFEFENGVEVVVEAPAVFVIESGLKMSLSQGKLSATVPPEGIGFTVETPSAEVVDFGTEFSVEVANDLSSEVHVFNGEVDVKPLVDTTAEPVRLVTNNATRIEHQSDVPIGIEVDHDRFLRSLAEPKRKYNRAVRALNPDIYYRMGPNTFDEGKGLQFISKRKVRPFIATGKVGASLRLGGPAKEGYALASTPPLLNSGKMSGVCWVFAQSRPRKATVASNLSYQGSGQFDWSFWRDSGHLNIRVQTLAGNEVQVREGVPLPIGQWHHVAFVADGEFLRLFRNGEEVASTPCGSLAESDDVPLAIGAFRSQSTNKARQFWHGRIDEFALFDNALTAEQIRNLFEQRPNPPEFTSTL